MIRYALIALSLASFVAGCYFLLTSRQGLALTLRAVTALQVGCDMLALFTAAKLQILRQSIVRSIHNMR